MPLCVYLGHGLHKLRNSICKYHVAYYVNHCIECGVKQSQLPIMRIRQQTSRIGYITRLQRPQYQNELHRLHLVAALFKYSIIILSVRAGIYGLWCSGLLVGRQTINSWILPRKFSYLHKHDDKFNFWSSRRCRRPELGLRRKYYSVFSKLLAFAADTRAHSHSHTLRRARGGLNLLIRLRRALVAAFVSQFTHNKAVHFYKDANSPGTAHSQRSALMDFHRALIPGTFACSEIVSWTTKYRFHTF